MILNENIATEIEAKIWSSKMIVRKIRICLVKILQNTTLIGVNFMKKLQLYLTRAQKLEPFKRKRCFCITAN
jgi:hypothetical protein